MSPPQDTVHSWLTNSILNAKLQKQKSWIQSTNAANLIQTFSTIQCLGNRNTKRVKFDFNKHRLPIKVRLLYAVPGMQYALNPMPSKVAPTGNRTKNLSNTMSTPIITPYSPHSLMVQTENCFEQNYINTFNQIT